KSQALLDEKALAACMAYVDLNPVRAGMAETPEQSEYTSFKERSYFFKKNSGRAKESNTPNGLLPFAGYLRKNMPKGLPFRLKDYLELVDWTGRAILENKRGYIPDHQPPVLERLQVDPKHWLYMTQHFESRFKGLVGASHALKAVCRKLEFRRTPNPVLRLLS
ncbi:MAG: transposase, partial [Candidatus Thiodiazotropha endolucinida]